MATKNFKRLAVLKEHMPTIKCLYDSVQDRNYFLDGSIEKDLLYLKRNVEHVNTTYALQIYTGSKNICRNVGVEIEIYGNDMSCCISLHKDHTSKSFTFAKDIWKSGHFEDLFRNKVEVFGKLYFLQVGVR